MKTEIVINDGSDMREIMDLLSNTALHRFNTNAPPLLDQFCVAREGDEMVGCCGSSLAQNGPLYLEQIYRIFDDAFPPLLSQRERLCEIGRWMSVVPDAAPLVLRGMIAHLENQGVNFALCEMVQPSYRRARALGIHFHEVAAELILENVDPTGRRYYHEKQPQLYWFDFSQILWR